MDFDYWCSNLSTSIIIYFHLVIDIFSSKLRVIFILEMPECELLYIKTFAVQNFALRSKLLLLVRISSRILLTIHLTFIRFLIFFDSNRVKLVRRLLILWRFWRFGRLQLISRPFLYDVRFHKLIFII